MASAATPLVPVSWGELIDKITILEIKRTRIDRADARANVIREHALLSATAAGVLRDDEVASLRDELLAVNEALWEIEDAIRVKEAAGAFDAEFVRLARAVYHRNDERAAIKRAINDALESELVEEKSYACMRPAMIVAAA